MILKDMETKKHILDTETYSVYRGGLRQPWYREGRGCGRGRSASGRCPLAGSRCQWRSPSHCHPPRTPVSIIIFIVFFTVLLTVFQTILMWVRTVKFANFVRGSKLRHFNGEFLWSTARFTSPDINIFKNVPFFKYFSLLIFLCKNWSIWRFLNTEKIMGWC